jgi:hypothetical protein
VCVCVCLCVRACVPACVLSNDHLRSLACVATSCQRLHHSDGDRKFVEAGRGRCSCTVEHCGTGWPLRRVAWPGAVGQGVEVSGVREKVLTPGADLGQSRRRVWQVSQMWATLREKRSGAFRVRPATRSRTGDEVGRGSSGNSQSLACYHAALNGSDRRCEYRSHTHGSSSTSPCCT